MTAFALVLVSLGAVGVWAGVSNTDPVHALAAALRGDTTSRRPLVGDHDATTWHNPNGPAADLADDLSEYPPGEDLPDELTQPNTGWVDAPGVDVNNPGSLTIPTDGGPTS